MVLVLRETAREPRRVEDLTDRRAVLLFVVAARDFVFPVEAFLRPMPFRDVRVDLDRRRRVVARLAFGME